MKKLCILLSAIMAIAMCMAFASCGSEDEGPTEIANPVHECSQDEMIQTTGIDIAAPENAEDVTYSYIEMNEASPVAQVVFKLDGIEYTYRSQFTDKTDIRDVDAGTELAGLHEKWKAGGTSMVQNRDAVFEFNEGKDGYIAWIDVVPGIIYSLSMDKEASGDMLNAMADSIFVEMQGEN